MDAMESYKGLAGTKCLENFRYSARVHIQGQTSPCRHGSHEASKVSSRILGAGLEKKIVGAFSAEMLVLAPDHDIWNLNLSHVQG